MEASQHQTQAKKKKEVLQGPPDGLQMPSGSSFLEYSGTLHWAFPLRR